MNRHPRRHLAVRGAMATACGLVGLRGRRLTHHPQLVTCAMCKRTYAFRERHDA